MLECFRGTLKPGNIDSSGRTIDEILARNLRLNRTAKMVDARIQRNLSVYEEYNAVTSTATLSQAHEYCRAVVPRQIYAIDPSTGGLLRDRLTGKQVTHLREDGDEGVVVLYPVCPARCTWQGCQQSHETLSDFGVGIALYFKTTLLMAGLCAALFCVTIPLMYCNYSYKEYVVTKIKPPYFCGYNFELTTNITSNSNFDWDAGTMILMLKDHPLIRFDFTRTRQPVTILQTLCVVVSLVLLLVAVIISKVYEENEIEQADQKVYTAKDYTIEVTGPTLPKNPKDFKSYYEKRFRNVRVVRVALIFKGAGTLLKAMKRRLKAERALAGKTEDLGRMGSETAAAIISPSCCKSFVQMLGCNRDQAWRQRELKHAEKAIDLANRQLYSNTAPPTHAFVTFDDELSQHKVMRGMQGDWCDRRSIRSDLGTHSSIVDHLEASKHTDAAEPADIIWENFDVHVCERWLRLLLSYLLAFCLLVGLYYALLNLTFYAQDQSLGPVSSFLLAAFVSLINLLLPILLKTTSYSEIHLRESAVQASIMIKLLILRFMNSAVLTFLVTRKSDFLSPDFVAKIQQIMILDVILPPLLRLMDVYNLFMRYVVGRCAKSQALMNAHFNGTYWNLAERYTDSMKKVFFCFFYVWVCPSGLAITGVGLLIDYYVDKYLLLRRWRKPPPIGPHLSITARVYFYLTVCVSTLLTIWAFRSWPFDCRLLKYVGVDATKGLSCEEEFAKTVFRSDLTMTWPKSENSIAATFGIPALVLLMIAAALAALKSTLVAAAWVLLKMACCTNSKVMPARSARRRHVANGKMSRLKTRIEKRETHYGQISSGRHGGILYSQLPHADWYIPRARAHLAEVSRAEFVNRWFYTTQSRMQSLFREDWKFAGQMSIDPDEFSSPKIYSWGNWVIEAVVTELVQRKRMTMTGESNNGRKKIEMMNEDEMIRQAMALSLASNIQRNVVPWYFYACDAEQVHSFLDGESHQIPVDASSESVQTLVREESARYSMSGLTIEELIANSPSRQNNASGVTIEELIANSPSRQNNANTLSALVEHTASKQDGELVNRAPYLGNGRAVDQKDSIHDLLKNSPSVQQGAIVLEKKK